MPLPKLMVEAARLPTRWLLRLPAEEEQVCKGVCFKASAMADKEAGSVSGGDSRHLCIGSKASTTAVGFVMSIGGGRVG